MTTGQSETSNSMRPKDCLACRLVGGVGMIGIGLYIGYHGFLRSGRARTSMYCIATGAFGLGVARILDYPPLEKTQ